MDDTTCSAPSPEFATRVADARQFCYPSTWEEAQDVRFCRAWSMSQMRASRKAVSPERAAAIRDAWIKLWPEAAAYTSRALKMEAERCTAEDAR